MTLHHKTAPSRPLCRRRFMAASAALGVALLLPGAALAAAVRELEGSVRVNGKDATRKTRVRPGDVIETGPKSKLVFVVGQDAFLLREQSRLSLDKSKGGKGTVISGLRLLTGALLAAFAEGPRTIETATATAGIRGTGVYIEASATETYFCTCYGEVELRDKAGTARKLVVSGYHTPNMIYARMVDGKMMVPAPFKDHTDDELIMLDRLVGRTSPIVDRDQKLKAAGGKPAQPEDMPQAPVQPQSEPLPKAEPPPAEPAPQAKPQSQAPTQPAATESPRTLSPVPPPEPVSPKPEPPPSDQELRLPPPRLN
jgi:hypothetical protein